MVRRRTLLTGLAATAAAVAGCRGDGERDGTDAADEENGPTTGVATTAAATDEGPGTAPPPMNTPSGGGRDDDGDRIDAGFEITSAVGTAIDDRSVGVLVLTVSPAAGVAIDASAVRVEWIDPSGRYSLVADTAGDDADGYFGVRPVTDANGSAPLLDDPADEFEFVFDLGDDDVDADDPAPGAARPGARAFGRRSAPGTVVSVQLATASGRSLTERLQVPDSLLGEDRVALKR